MLSTNIWNVGFKLEYQNCEIANTFIPTCGHYQF